MTRPAVLDMDLVVVPREVTDEMASSGADAFFSPEPVSTAQENARAASVFRRAISASPYPTAWDDVRKYVEGLERERDDMRLSSQHSADWASQAITDMKAATSRTESAEARIAELDAALDEKEVASGLTSNGNLWRFWSTKASALAVRNAELEAELASLAELYGDEEKPRYTTRRLRMEVERAKAAADIRIAELEKEKHAALTMIAMLEKRLADAERVIERVPPYLADMYRAICNGNEMAAGGFSDSDDLVRAARAYMEGK